MNDLSKKALIVLSILKNLEATDKEHKAHIYTILDKLENTNLKDILPNEEEYELDCIRCEMSQKSVSTTLASLVRHGYVEKTGTDNVRIKDETKNIRGYYLTNK